MPKQDLKLWRPIAGYKAEKEKQVEALTQQRTGLKNELKRYLRKEDFQSAEATEARIGRADRRAENLPKGNYAVQRHR